MDVYREVLAVVSADKRLVLESDYARLQLKFKAVVLGLAEDKIVPVKKIFADRRVSS